MNRARFAAALFLTAFVPGLSRAVPIETLTGVLASGRPVEVVSGQVLVRFSTSPVSRTGAAAAVPEGEAAAQERSRALKAMGAVDRGELARTGWTLVDLPPGMKVSEGLSWVKSLPGVDEAGPNHVLRVNRTPNDPQYPSQWALQKVSASGAWEFEVGGSSRVTIAVIDTGIDASHGDLAGKLVGASKSFDPKLAGDNPPAAANQPPTPACNHGTRVAGVAAASSDNGLGISGMSWGAGLLSLKVFRDADCNLTEDGCQLFGCITSVGAVTNAIAHAQTLHNTAAVGKVVINMSVGDIADCPTDMPVMQAAVTNAVNAGLILVASAGNNGDNVMAPANCTGVIPVGASDQNDAVAAFSSRGPPLAANGLVAPGVSVLTTTPGGGYSGATGTSFSAPMVAGVAALIWSARPDFGLDQVKQVLRLSADNIGTQAMGQAQGVRAMGDFSGAGRLNAFRAVRMAVRGSQTDLDLKAIAFPNPFRLAQDGQVTLSVPVSIQGANRSIKIYSAAGGFVKELSGTSWDGKNAAGLRVASGVYTFVVTTDRGAAVGRLTVVR